MHVTLLAVFYRMHFADRRAAEEIDRYAGLVKRLIAKGDSVESAIRAGLRAVVCSPEFLFLERILGTGQRQNRRVRHRVTSFLLSVEHDARPGIVGSGRPGQLHDAAVRRRQVERMLANPKAAELTRNFTGQWLKLRQLGETEPDQMLYPEYDALLENSMREETQRFFEEIVRNDLSVTEFVNSDWSILNDRLAKHYGVPGVVGAQLRRVNLTADSVRGGLLTQASVLKVTANGTTTSPVLRGAWAIENLLGIHVPPPPPVPAVEPDLTGATTLRQQLDKHRNDVSCASCHSKIDPAGFALESFDAIGGWRDRYRIPLGTDVVLEAKKERGLASHLQAWLASRLHRQTPVW